MKTKNANRRYRRYWVIAAARRPNHYDYHYGPWHWLQPDGRFIDERQTAMRFADPVEAEELLELIARDVDSFNLPWLELTVQPY